MPIDDRALNGAVPASHRIAAAAEFARSATLSLAPVFRASRAVFSDRSAGSGEVHFVNWPAWCRSHYCRYVRSRDPIRRWLDSPEVHRGGVARLSDIASCGVPTPFADTLMSRSGACFVLTIALRDRARIIGALSLVRDVEAGDFSGADCELARAQAQLLEMAYRGAVGGQPGVATVPAPHGIDPMAALTPREREVAALAAAGHPNKAIARMLDASPWTVKNHMRAVFEKTGVHNRIELARAIE